MNKPLRYKGYTFFQSAYERDQSGEEITILAVVENKGRIFPYLGTIKPKMRRCYIVILQIFPCCMTAASSRWMSSPLQL